LLGRKKKRIAEEWQNKKDIVQTYLDYMTPKKLVIELVPSTVWYASIYQYCKKSNKLQKFQELKNELFKIEGRKCWICKKKISN